MAEPQSPVLSNNEVARLISAVGVWVERHPYPDHAAFAFADSQPFSPRDLLRALSEGGPVAERFLRMTRFALEDESFDAIVNQFEQGRELQL
jgi:hypothetical protein